MTDKKATAVEPDKQAETIHASEASAGTRKRPVRITRDLLLNKGPLVVPESIKKPGMVYFWMKDEPYKFEEYARLGYDFALDEHQRKVRKARTGEEMVLLEIPKELHDEIRAIKHDIRMEKTTDRRGIHNPRQPNQVEGTFEERLIIK